MKYTLLITFDIRGVTILIKIAEEHEAESTFLKNKNFVFVTFRLPQVN